MKTENQKMRDDFESHVNATIGSDVLTVDEDGDYTDIETSVCWGYWQASAANSAKRIAEFQKELDGCNAQLAAAQAYAKELHRIALLAKHNLSENWKEVRTFLEAPLLDTSALDKLREHDKAQLAILNKQINTLCLCLDDTAHQRGGWAWEEVIGESQLLLSATAESSEQFIRDKQAEALEELAISKDVTNTGYVGISVIRRMAADKRSGK